MRNNKRLRPNREPRDRRYKHSKRDLGLLQQANSKRNKRRRLREPLDRLD